MIANLRSGSQKVYGVGLLQRGHHQYMDRLYQFDYVPRELASSLHIRTHGNDKMLPETEPCLCFDLACSAELYILYPDKQPVLPRWLERYERMRMNVTRIDSQSDNLKGYFSLYRRVFSPGKVVLYGNSPLAMLAEDWYLNTGGGNYCMYSVCLRPVHD